MIYQVYLAGTGNIFDPSNPEKYIIDPKLTMTVNEPGSFEFTLPITHIVYDSIHTLSSTIDIVEKGAVIWTGRVTEIEVLFNRNKRIRCEGALSFFKDIILDYKEYDPTTLSQFFEDVITRYNAVVDSTDRKFTAATNIAEGLNDTIWRKTDYENAYDVLHDMIIESDGGYFALTKSSPGSGRVTITYYDDFKTNAGQPIVYASNLVDMTHGTNAENVVTDLIPVCHYDNKVYKLKGLESDWSQYQTELNDNTRNVKPTSKGYVINKNLRNTYGAIEKVIEYDMVENLYTMTTLVEKEKAGTITQAEATELANERAANAAIILKTKKQMYKSAKKKAKELEYATFSMSARVADLANLTYEQTEVSNFLLGTLVSVTSNPHGISNRRLPIWSMGIDLNSGVKELTIGIPESQELSKITKPRSKQSRDSQKHIKDNTYTPDKLPLGELRYTQTHEDLYGKYYLNDSVDLDDFKTGLLYTNGDTDDVTEDTTFTINDGTAEGYTFLTRDNVPMVAHYTLYDNPLEATTVLKVRDSLMTWISIIPDGDLVYHFGDTFDLTKYSVKGYFDNNHYVDIPYNHSDLHWNMADGITLSASTPKVLTAMYNGVESQGIELWDTEELIFKNLYFSHVYDGQWEIGDTFSLEEYTVTWTDRYGNSLDVTKRCTYNLGNSGDYSYTGANQHVIAGSDPNELIATFRVGNTDLIASTPLSIKKETIWHGVKQITGTYHMECGGWTPPYTSWLCDGTLDITNYTLTFYRPVALMYGWSYSNPEEIVDDTWYDTQIVEGIGRLKFWYEFETFQQAYDFWMGNSNYCIDMVNYAHDHAYYGHAENDYSYHCLVKNTTIAEYEDYSGSATQGNYYNKNVYRPSFSIPSDYSGLLHWTNLSSSMVDHDRFIPVDSNGTIHWDRTTSTFIWYDVYTGKYAWFDLDCVMVTRYSYKRLSSGNYWKEGTGTWSITQQV